MLAVFAGDLAGDLEQPVDRLLDAPDGVEEHGEQDGDDQRGAEADAQRDRPVGCAEVASKRERHFPTATFRSDAGGVQDPHAGVVDLRDAGELVGLLAHDLDRLLGGPSPAGRSAARAARSRSRSRRRRRSRRPRARSRSANRWRKRASGVALVLALHQEPPHELSPGRCSPASLSAASAVSQVPRNDAYAANRRGLRDPRLRLRPRRGSGGEPAPATERPALHPGNVRLGRGLALRSLTCVACQVDQLPGVFSRRTVPASLRTKAQMLLVSLLSVLVMLFASTVPGRTRRPHTRGGRTRGQAARICRGRRSGSLASLGRTGWPCSGCRTRCRQGCSGQARVTTRTHLGGLLTRAHWPFVWVRASDLF